MPDPIPTTATGIENITVFADASFCPNTKAGGGAYWARWGKASADKASGAFGIRGVQHSHEAEVIAACRAILQLAEHETAGPLLALGRRTRLVLVIDCLTIKHVFENANPPLCPEARQLVGQVKALRDRLHFWLKVNHVKAHKGQDSPRKWVNHWCDRQARQQMQALRSGA